MSVLANLRELARLDFWRELRQMYRQRHVQEEVDMHRLYLYTCAYEHFRGPSMEQEDKAALERIARAAEALSFVGRKQQVESHVNEQLKRMAQEMKVLIDQEVMSATLSEEVGSEQMQQTTGETTYTEEPRRGSLGAMMHGLQQQQQSAQRDGKRDPLLLKRRAEEMRHPEAFSKELQKRVGFTLRLDKSSIQHPEAGLGVFYCGQRALAGQVVSLYPGIVYRKDQLKFMKDYPKIDKNNDFLLGRFDGSVFDALPWGRDVLLADAQGNGTKFAPDVDDDLLETLPIWARKVLKDWVRGTSVEKVEVERRNPYALAHMVNHPPQGKQPNVMVCATETTMLRDDELRPFFPSIGYKKETEMDRTQVSSLAMVAIADIHDGDELLADYRYSPHWKRPEWYYPCNLEEEKRRWA